MNRLILRGITILGLGCLPFLMIKQPRKNWIIVFFLKGLFSIIIDNYIVRKKRVEYPVRFLPNFYDICLLFDCLLFPLACTYFNQVTYHAKPLSILKISLWFSLPITLIEWMLEKKTDLVKWKKWSVMHTYISENAMFLLVRALMELISLFTGGKAKGESRLIKKVIKILG